MSKASRVQSFVPRRRYRFVKDYAEAPSPHYRSVFYAHEAREGEVVVFEYKSLGEAQFWFVDRRHKDGRRVPIMLSFKDCFKYLEDAL